MQLHSILGLPVRAILLVGIISSAMSSVSIAQSRLPVVVKAVDGGVEVVRYNRQDDLFQPGDLITWVGTPNSNSHASVDSPQSLEAEAFAYQDSQGNIAFWVKRGNSEATWMFLNLSQIESTDSKDEASVLHVLLVYDPKAENDVFRWGCDFDVYRITAFLARSIPQGRFIAHSFATPTQDAEGFLTAIRQYKETISPNDSLLVYYSGHGSNDEISGQMLDLRPGVQVARTDVRQAMLDSGARLCLLITDCCAAGSSAPLYSSLPSSSKDYTAPYWNANICRALFFRHSGFVDVTSAGPGELAWSTGPIDQRGRFIGRGPFDGDVFDNGGLFTTSLLEVLSMHDGELQHLDMLDSQGRITWESIQRYLQHATENRFQTRIFPVLRQRDKERHQHQTVTFLSTGVPTGDALPKTCRSILGVDLYQGKDGVYAGSVDPDLSPNWVGIKPGDKLLSVRRFDDSYDAHFWTNRKFTGGEQSSDLKSINELTSLRESMTPADPNSVPYLSSGLWTFSVERNGAQTEVSVRITEPSDSRP